MTIRTLWELARPRTSADRRRWTLVAVACALTGALVLTAARILRYQQGPLVLAPYVEDRGLRPGILTAAVLTCLPPLVLLIQALRVASAARERRLVALRVAGASTAQLARLATLEGASAGFVGGAVGGVLYVALGWLTLAIPTRYARLVPPADLLDVALWPATAVAVAVLAGLCARVTAHEVSVAPQRTSVRLPRPLPHSRAGVAAALLLVVSCLAVVVAADPAGWPDWIVYLLIAAAVLMLFTAAPYVVLLAARRLHRSADPMAQLAAARVRADPRTPGRITAVVCLCGASFSVCAVFVADVLQMGGDLPFYLSGVALALGAAVIALLVGVLSLVVGAAEQVLDARRATATLTAFGVGADDLTRALRRQLGAVTVPGVVVGAVLGALPAIGLIRSFGAVGAARLGIAVAAGVAMAAARLAARLLQPQVVGSTSAENLRTA